MWVYFNVPEARYLEYQARPDNDNVKVELVLANGETLPQIGKMAAIEADFNNETGNTAFRADFPNPDGLLRHGQTGTILLSRVVKDTVVIPQRATFEILSRWTGNRNDADFSVPRRCATERGGLMANVYRTWLADHDTLERPVSSFPRKMTLAHQCIMLLIRS